VFLNNGGHLLHLANEFEANGISVDWRTSLDKVVSAVGPKLTVQGNLPPTKLFSVESELKQDILQMLGRVSRKTGFVANLGHGVLQGTPVDAVKTFVETVHDYRLDATRYG
jgi:uroporphyrinogen decarboxylase